MSASSTWWTAALLKASFVSGLLSKDEPLVLKNKAPRWPE
jgi:hypothetical protein